MRTPLLAVALSLKYKNITQGDTGGIFHSNYFYLITCKNYAGDIFLLS